MLRVDGVQLPPAVQDRLQTVLEPQIIEEPTIIIGGLPAEYGEDVAGVVDVKTRRLQRLQWAGRPSSSTAPTTPSRFRPTPRAAPGPSTR